MATTLADVRRAAKPLKVEIETGPEEYELCAPDGHRFAATETHYMVFSWAGRYPYEHRPAALDSMLSDLKYGLESCPDGCECREEG